MERPSRLRGRGLEKTTADQPESRLRGKGLKSPEQHDEVTADTVVGRVVIQRDSGDRYKVSRTHMPEMGGKRLVANLESIDGTRKFVTLAVEDLLDRLKTPGGPWTLEN